MEDTVPVIGSPVALCCPYLRMCASGKADRPNRACRRGRLAESPTACVLPRWNRVASERTLCCMASRIASRRPFVGAVRRGTAGCGRGGRRPGDTEAAVRRGAAEFLVTEPSFESRERAALAVVLSNQRVGSSPRPRDQCAGRLRNRPFENVDWHVEQFAMRTGGRGALGSPSLQRRAGASITVTAISGSRVLRSSTFAWQVVALHRRHRAIGAWV